MMIRVRVSLVYMLLTGRRSCGNGSMVESIIGLKDSNEEFGIGGISYEGT